MRRAAAAALTAAIVAVVVIVGIIDVSEGSGSTRPAHLAYVTGTAGSAPQVWVANLRDAHNSTRIGPGQQPLVSRDGAVIAASTPAHGGPALLLYTPGGTVLRRFFDAARTSAVAQAWSPDSRYLAVVLSSRDPASAAASGLAVIDTKTLSARIVASGAVYGASFAPGGSDRIAYAVAARPALQAAVDIHVIAPDGSGDAPITRDGASLYPVWGPTGIAYTHEQLRPTAAPAYQVWLMNADGTGSVPLTHVAVPPLMDGLVPIAFSSDGAWVLAQYEGLNTSQGWAIEVGSRRAHRLEIDGAPVTAAATSRFGAGALVVRGGYLRPPSEGTIEELPLGAGRVAKLVAHASEPSWNQ